MMTGILKGLLVVGVLMLQIVKHCQAASSGDLIIRTAKKAFENAARRQRRDLSAVREFTLLPNPRDPHIVEFDLILDDDQYKTLDMLGARHIKHRRQKRKAVRHSIYHWPGAEVPYQIHSSVDSISPMARHRIQKAMTHWEKHSCIKFVKFDPTKHINSVSIRKGQWCASKLGMAGGVQPLYLALGCLDTGTIIHEIGHVLGWIHEQARPDRDDYISIKWSLVSSSYKSQYVKHGTDFINTYNVPYDYDSIMHYPSYGEIITKDASAQYRIGQRNRLSFNDIKLANVMYKCAERAKCDTSKLECINGGFINQKCQCVCPDGDHRSCAVTNSIYDPYPVVKTTPIVKVCKPWTMYDNAYIPGRNDDVGFGLSIEECKERCMRETSFECRSFDYWKQRRQCYLSSSTATNLGIRFARDSRMVHYQLNDCPTVPPPNKSVFPSVTNNSVSGSNNSTNVTAPVPITIKHKECPFEYASINGACVRALGFPMRPEYIAKTECKQKFRANLWNFKQESLQQKNLASIVTEGVGFWVEIDNFKSDNLMSTFFKFCPYLTKENGKVVLKDTFCYKMKGFLCQL